MYLHEIHIRHLKLLRDFRLSFLNPDGSVRMWTAIIGENGTAKTSILQAIALAAAGPAQVNTLARPVIGHLRDHRTTGTMKVNARFGFTATHHQKNKIHPLLPPDRSPEGLSLRSTLELSRDSRTLFGQTQYENGEEVIALKRGDDPLDIARSRSLPLWFVAGYGVGRFLPDPSQAPQLEQPGIERMESLFRNTTSLTSLRFLDHFSDEKARQFSTLLRDVLTVTDGLVPDVEGIELRGNGGIRRAGQLIDTERFLLRVGSRRQKVPAVALSHGYQSVIAWVADLIGHVMLEASEPIQAADIEGLVLLDEADLYLHPRWQVGLLQAMRHTFPKVQFIVTTHSPVLLSSLAPHEIVRLMVHPDSGDVERAVRHPDTGEWAPFSTVGSLPSQPDPRTMTGTDVYREWFELDRLTLNPHGHTLRRYTQLATDPYRSDAEEQELHDLRRELHRHEITHIREPLGRALP